MKREKLIKSKGYNVTKIQNELFRQLTEYIADKGITRTQFAKELGVSKGYVSQILNGDFDFKLSKLVELSLAIGKIPEINFKPIAESKVEKIKVKLFKSKTDFLLKLTNPDYSIKSSNHIVWVKNNYGIEIKDNSKYENASMN